MESRWPFSVSQLVSLVGILKCVLFFNSGGLLDAICMVKQCFLDLDRIRENISFTNFLKKFLSPTDILN